jgi:hypothetical protein
VLILILSSIFAKNQVLLTFFLRGLSLEADGGLLMRESNADPASRQVHIIFDLWRWMPSGCHKRW